MSNVGDKCYVCNKPLKRGQLILPIQDVIENRTFGREAVTVRHAHIEHFLNPEQAP